MSLINRYQFPGIDDQLIATLPPTIEKHLGLTAIDIQQSPIFCTAAPPNSATAATAATLAPIDRSTAPPSWLCATHLTYVLRTIVDGTPDDSSSALSPRHQQLVVAWLAATARLHLAANLDPCLLQNPLLSADGCRQPPADSRPLHGAAERQRYLRVTVDAFAAFFRHGWLLNEPALDATIVQYMSALYWFAHIAATAATPVDDGNDDLLLLRDLRSAAAAGRYIRFVLIIKANPELPAGLHERLHRDLLHCVSQPGGYTNLLRSMQPAEMPADAHQLHARLSDSIGQICARANHTDEFQARFVVPPIAFTSLLSRYHPHAPTRSAFAHSAST